MRRLPVAASSTSSKHGAMSSLTELSSELKEADFESIPIMYAAPASELMVRDLADASSRDPTKRRALAAEIRRVCLNEGFFYGEQWAKGHNLAFS